jgi:HSP20 family molecular chaperone IbpA
MGFYSYTSAFDYLEKIFDNIDFAVTPWSSKVNVDATAVLRDWMPSFPPTNVKIDKKTKDITFELAVAGYPKENIDIEFDGEYMKVTMKKVEKKDEECECICCGMTKGTHVAKYGVPASKYDRDKVSATMKDGILSIKIPAKEITTYRVNIN